MAIYGYGICAETLVRRFSVFRFIFRLNGKNCFKNIAPKLGGYPSWKILRITAISVFGSGDPTGRKARSKSGARGRQGCQDARHFIIGIRSDLHDATCRRKNFSPTPRDPFLPRGSTQTVTPTGSVIETFFVARPKLLAGHHSKSQNSHPRGRYPTLNSHSLVPDLAEKIQVHKTTEILHLHAFFQHFGPVDLFQNIFLFHRKYFVFCWSRGECVQIQNTV